VGGMGAAATGPHFGLPRRGRPAAHEEAGILFLLVLAILALVLVAYRGSHSRAAAAPPGSPMPELRLRTLPGGAVVPIDAPGRDPLAAPD